MDSKPLPFMAIAAVAVLAGFGFREQQRATTKWEYRSLVIVRRAESNSEWTRWGEASAGGYQELPGPVNVSAKATELGEAGWELVTVTPMSNNAGGHITQGYGSSDIAGFTSQVVYYFKRPK